MQVELQEKIESCLKPLIPPATRRIAIIDPPDHPNIGDSAILLGELDFLWKNFPETELVFVSHKFGNAAAARAIDRCDMLLFHGGGNFGDIWPALHRFRLDVMRNHPEIPKIQLPQSVHFDDIELKDETADVIGMQKSFTLLVRDAKSFEAARSFNCSTILCPDLAFYMEKRRLPIARKPAIDLLALVRTDKESASGLGKQIERALTDSARSYEVIDWLDEKDQFFLQAAHFVANQIRLRPKMSSVFGPIYQNLLTTHAARRVTRGFRLLNRGRVGAADRLHAHILFTILGKPHLIADSYDGKISAFYETWTKKSGCATFMDDSNEVGAVIGQFVQQFSRTDAIAE
ncbi:MAG: polysaccharide pyruvyl transferase family protein [Parvularculaceae bacterium]